MPGCISSLPDNGLVLVTLPQGEGERLVSLTPPLPACLPSCLPDGAFTPA